MHKNKKEKINFVFPKKKAKKKAERTKTKRCLLTVNLLE